MRPTDSGHIRRPISGETVWRISVPITGSAGAESHSVSSRRLGK